jgi:hypothetical protein
VVVGGIAAVYAMVVGGIAVVYDVVVGGIAAYSMGLA